MIIHTYTMTDTINYSSGATVSKDIARQGYITHIDTLLKVVYDTASSVTANEDPFARLIDGMGISTAGRYYYNVSDGRQALFLGRCQYQDNIRVDSISTTPSQSGIVDYMAIPIHLGVQFYNSSDVTVVIPAWELSSLKFEVDWGTNSDLGTGYTIDSSTKMYLTIKEILLQEGETIEAIMPAGKLLPRMTSSEKPVSSAYSNLSLEEDLPVGDLLSWILLVVYGNTSATRCNNLVTELAIKFPREATTVFKSDFLPEVSATRRRWALSNDYKGVVFLPLSEVSGDELGYDLAGYQVGDAKICYSTSLSDTTEDNAQAGGGTIYQLFYNIGLG